MPAVTLYLADDDYELYKKLGRGNASRLFSNTLREETGALEDLDRVNKKLAALNEEKLAVENRFKFLESRKKALEEREESIKQQKQNMETKNAERITTLSRWITELYVIEESAAFELATEWSNKATDEQNKFGSALKFVESKGYAIRK